MLEDFAVVRAVQVFYGAGRISAIAGASDASAVREGVGQDTDNIRREIYCMRFNIKDIPA